MACLEEDGTHPELRHRFIRNKIKDPTELKTLLHKQDGMLSEQKSYLQKTAKNPRTEKKTVQQRQHHKDSLVNQKH